MPTKLPAIASLPSRVKATEVMSSGSSVQICAECQQVSVDIRTTKIEVGAHVNAFLGDLK